MVFRIKEEVMGSAQVEKRCLGIQFTLCTWRDPSSHPYKTVTGAWLSLGQKSMNQIH